MVAKIKGHLESIFNSELDLTNESLFELDHPSTVETFSRQIHDLPSLSQVPQEFLFLKSNHFDGTFFDILNFLFVIKFSTFEVFFIVNHPQKIHQSIFQRNFQLLFPFIINLKPIVDTYLTSLDGIIYDNPTDRSTVTNPCLNYFTLIHSTLQFGLFLLPPLRKFTF